MDIDIQDALKCFLSKTEKQLDKKKRKKNS
jgi:hypothetical protein